MLSPDFIARYADLERSPETHPLKSGPFGELPYIVYKRTYARPLGDRSEEWHETVARVVQGAQDIGAGLTDDEARRLYDHIWNLRGLPGGRMIWQLGTPNVDRFGAASLTNCWYTRLETPEDFGWLFDMLMLGGGVGYSVRNPEALGVVREASVRHDDAPDADFIVPDKREGWVELIVRTLRAYLGDDRDPAHFTYSTALVRPAGSPIKTFGGVASGPGVLIEGVADIAAVLDRAVGRHLTSVEVLDLANIIGRIVVSGNVRRSAQIALGAPFDVDFLQAKRWDLGDVPDHRAMSNNTVVTGDVDALPDAFWEGYHGNGEPYGLFNLEAARTFARAGEYRPDWSVEGTNPCGEITLAHRESCNLAEIVLPNVRDEDELIDVAILLYKVQKAVAALGYRDPQSNAITAQNMRLGLGVTGVAQATERLPWLDRAYRALVQFDAEWSSQRGYPTSVRLTTVKPSGTLSILAGVTPGAHPGFSRFHVRRVRMAANDPLVAYCEAAGYPVEAAVGFSGEPDPYTVVVEFPCSFPEGTTFAGDVSAVDQLEIQRTLQTVWADNAVSITVYYRPDELPEVRDYLRRHYHQMKSVSFLPYQDHGFTQAPLEAITEADYLARVAAIHGAETDGWDGGGTLDDMECSTGACPVR